MSTSPPSAKRGGSSEAALTGLIDELDLAPLQKDFLRGRWLDQVTWLERRAGSAQRWYNRLRLLTIVGGVIIPALVGLDVTGRTSEVIRWSVFGLSLVVALAASIEGFFHFSDRWPHYRRTAELLKSEGWQFFQLCGPYARFSGHSEAYPLFAAQVEGVMQRDVDIFFATLAGERDAQRATPPTEQTQQADGPSEQRPPLPGPEATA